jgi:hypothetical protein
MQTVEIKKDKPTEQDSECCEMCLMEFIQNQFIYRLTFDSEKYVLCSMYCVSGTSLRIV